MSTAEPLHALKQPAVPAPRRPRHLLLVEPDSLVRRTVIGVARELALADVREASNYEGAGALMETGNYDGVIVALTDQHDEGLKLIQRLRSGETSCDPECPVAVMVSAIDAARATTLHGLKVRRVILKPFKVKTVLETMAQMVPA